MLIFACPPLIKLVKDLGFNANIEMKIKEDIPTYTIYSDNDSLLIGKNGKNLKALSVIALSALTAGGVAYLSNNCPKKSAKLQETINTQIAQYIEKNPHIILEKIAKSENFGNYELNKIPFTKEMRKE